MSNEESEFGKGLTYCLALFLAHTDKFKRDKQQYENNSMSKYMINDLPHMWFNGASDHLYEMEIPHIESPLEKRLKDFCDKCLEWGHGCKRKPTEQNVKWAIEECKILLREIDKSLLGVKVAKGTWE